MVSSILMYCCWEIWNGERGKSDSLQVVLGESMKKNNKNNNTFRIRASYKVNQTDSQVLTLHYLELHRILTDFSTRAKKVREWTCRSSPFRSRIRISVYEYAYSRFRAFVGFFSLQIWCLSDVSLALKLLTSSERKNVADIIWECLFLFEFDKNRASKLSPIIDPTCGLFKDYTTNFHTKSLKIMHHKINTSQQITKKLKETTWNEPFMMQFSFFLPCSHSW